ncbi:MAG: hypothetical protein GY773_09295, partial [Actinomycetia bacterium]|nr:hypothetical protein [Actinomycetes bacterium]
MTEITVEESFAQIEALNQRADRARTEGRHDDAIDALTELLAHPCAHHQIYDWEVLNDIHELHRRAKQWD